MTTGTCDVGGGGEGRPEGRTLGESCRLGCTAALELVSAGLNVGLCNLYGSHVRIQAFNHDVKGALRRLLLFGPPGDPHVIRLETCSFLALQQHTRHASRITRHASRAPHNAHGTYQPHRRVHLSQHLLVTGAHKHIKRSEALAVQDDLLARRRVLELTSTLLHLRVGGGRG